MNYFNVIIKNRMCIIDFGNIGGGVFYEIIIVLIFVLILNEGVIFLYVI